MIEQAASDIGLAFQIQDDILDVTSTSQELSDLICKLWKICQRYLVYIIRLIDLFQHPSYPSFISCGLPFP